MIQKHQTALIIEDHPLYCDALIHILHALVGESNVYATYTAEEGLKLATTLPNLTVILLDLSLPGLNGIEAILAFRRQLPTVPIIIISAAENPQEAVSTLNAGAIAFVSKAASGTAMSDLIQRLLTGELTEPELLIPSSNNLLSPTQLPKLTPRQLETLTLLTQGLSNKEIALRLDLAEITVKVHISALFRALGVVNRTQVVMAARRLGLVS